MTKAYCIVLLVAFIVSGCSCEVSEVQFIDIQIYKDNDENKKLIEDLVYYDPRYIAYIVPSLNDSTAKGIEVGYFTRSSNDKTSYRIRYNLAVASVSENLEQLKSDFEKGINLLAYSHASKSELFHQLSGVGKQWVQTLSNKSAQEVLSGSSASLKNTTSPDELEVFLKNMNSEFGLPLSTEFLRAQYYDPFADVPRSVALYYLQTYDNDKKAFIRVSFEQEKGKWKVLGVSVNEHA
ncbi:DUF4019 domain-containing protein [Vibrio parahaemolyticus]|uniref:DUF4019 domain-containing protein n=1 Tax=Vibrio parahaemolyticus TaxID=670 RepID=UPI0023624DBE|nr:DUF4019 domain-containing protein [Vibrio parahaemolyticus]MDF5346206.1 DUF4019 domain-containing protein [Vibrio parahaemolyticus]